MKNKMAFAILLIVLMSCSIIDLLNSGFGGTVPTPVINKSSHEVKVKYFQSDDWISIGPGDEAFFGIPNESLDKVENDLQYSPMDEVYFIFDQNNHIISFYNKL